MQRADCDAHKSRRICALPIVILLADRLSRISAPASAARGARRLRHPEVLADLDVERERGGSRCREHQVGAERRLMPGDGDRSAAHALAGGEMPPLVEFAVIRQKYFRDDPEHMAAVDRRPRNCRAALRAATAPRRQRPSSRFSLAATSRSICASTASSTASWNSRSSIE